MLLKIYIITTVLSLVVLFITSQSVLARLKREGYPKSKDTGYSFFEKIHAFLPLFIPVVNVFIAMVCLFDGEKVYEISKKKYFETQGGSL